MWKFALLQLTEGANAVMSDRNDRERAIRLLRDSLCDARVVLTKSLTNSLDSNVPKDSESDVAMSRSLESVLERYSEQLSSRALQLFKEKLDEQMHPDVTKL